MMPMSVDGAYYSCIAVVFFMRFVWVTFTDKWRVVIEAEVISGSSVSKIMRMIISSRKICYHWLIPRHLLDVRYPFWRQHRKAWSSKSFCLTDHGYSLFNNIWIIVDKNRMCYDPTFELKDRIGCNCVSCFIENPTITWICYADLTALGWSKFLVVYVPGLRMSFQNVGVA